jgi:hypothetical protein
MRRTERGFTILEMLVLMVFLSSFLALLTSTMVVVRKTDDEAEALSKDLLGMTRALAALEADGRASTRVETDGAGEVRMETTRGPVAYRVREGVLSRSAEGRWSVLARGVRDLSVVPENGLLRATVRMTRAHEGKRRKPEATTWIAPRGGEAGR